MLFSFLSIFASGSQCSVTGGIAVQTVIRRRLFRVLFISWIKKKGRAFTLPFLFGADYGARTRHLNLGKVALYQMS